MFENLELSEALPYASTLTEEGVQRSVDAASAAGFEIVRGAPNVLLLDLDIPFEDRHTLSDAFLRVFDCINRNFPIQSMEEWPSKSGNTHVRIRLFDNLPVETRCALQAALGSDGVREALILARLRNGVVEPSILFKPKGGK